MDLKFLDDTNNSNNDNELEKIKKENILLKQQLADARADNFLKLYEDLKRENAIILQEIKNLKNNKTTTTNLTYSPCLKAGDSWIQTILAY